MGRLQMPLDAIGSQATYRLYTVTYACAAGLLVTRLNTVQVASAVIGRTWVSAFFRVLRVVYAIAVNSDTDGQRSRFPNCAGRKQQFTT